MASAPSAKAPTAQTKISSFALCPGAPHYLLVYWPQFEKNLLVSLPQKLRGGKHQFRIILMEDSANRIFRGGTRGEVFENSFQVVHAIHGYDRLNHRERPGVSNGRGVLRQIQPGSFVGEKRK